jgi:uncharacterized protein with HEPN domain
LPSRQPIARLQDIVENIDRIERYTVSYDFDRFASDRQCQDAVERCLLRIAEAATKLGPLLESIAPDQRWSQIRGVGNILRHEYDNVDPTIIWEIIVSELASLKDAVATALQKMQTGQEGPA